MSKANVFIVLNLGCEMLYVIDQRLKAQCVNLNKSAQILRDLTTVLLDPTFLKQLSTYGVDRSPLTPQQCRILFKDIACSSIMHVDTPSMDKLWDLMTMIFKWQFHTMNLVNKSDLLNLTFRHLDGIGKLIPELHKQMLIDLTKTNLLHFWNSTLTDEDYMELKCDVTNWLSNFNIKISILLRLGFQKPNGKFFYEILNTEHFAYYSLNLGENIYTKNFSAAKVAQTSSATDDKMATVPTNSACNEIDKFTVELNVRCNKDDSGENPLFLDEINSTSTKVGATTDKVKQHEFILIKNIDQRKTIDSIFAKLHIDDDKITSHEDCDVSAPCGSDAEINFTDKLLEMLDETIK